MTSPNFVNLPRTVKYLSDDGTATGNLTPAGGHYITEVTVDIPVTTVTYLDGQVMGGLLELDSVGVCPGVGVQPIAVTLFSKDPQTSPIDLHLFINDPSTTFTDAASFALDAADYDARFDVVHVSEWADQAGPSFGKAEGLSVPFQLPGTQNKIWAVPVARGSVTVVTAAPDSFGLTLRSLSEG